MKVLGTPEIKNNYQCSLVAKLGKKCKGKNIYETGVDACPFYIYEEHDTINGIYVDKYMKGKLSELKKAIIKSRNGGDMKEINRIDDAYKVWMKNKTPKNSNRFNTILIDVICKMDNTLFKLHNGKILKAFVTKLYAEHGARVSLYQANLSAVAWIQKWRNECDKGKIKYFKESVGDIDGLFKKIICQLNGSGFEKMKPELIEYYYEYFKFFDKNFTMQHSLQHITNIRNECIPSMITQTRLHECRVGTD